MTEDARSRTCTGDELERLTGDGWVLRETRDEDRQEIGYSYGSNETVNGYTQFVNKTAPPVVVRRPVFILGRSRDTELDKMRAELTLATNEHRTSRECQKAAEKARDEAVKALEACEATRKREGETYIAEVKRGDAERVRARKLEADIATIRREIGEARFREILPPAGPTGGKAQP